MLMNVVLFAYMVLNIHKRRLAETQVSSVVAPLITGLCN